MILKTAVSAAVYDEWVKYILMPVTICHFIAINNYNGDVLTMIKGSKQYRSIYIYTEYRTVLHCIGLYYTVSHIFLITMYH